MNRKQIVTFPFRCLSISRIPPKSPGLAKEALHKLKYIDYRAVKFPEVNPVELEGVSQGKKVLVANYRYPS